MLWYSVNGDICPRSDGMKRLFWIALGLLLAGCERNPYVKQQLKSAEAGDYFAKYNLWDAYQNGRHGVNADRSRADQWLREITKDVWVVKFEPADSFRPSNPMEYLKYMSKYSHLNSEKQRIGIAGFFRTTKEGGVLRASFLTNYPDKLREDIEKMPNLKVTDVAELTPKQFVEYVRQPQESL